jgi:ribosomal protein L24E
MDIGKVQRYRYFHRRLKPRDVRWATHGHGRLQHERLEKCYNGKAPIIT